MEILVNKKQQRRKYYLYVVDGDSWIAKWYKRKGFIPFKKSSDGSCDMFLEINKK